MGAWIKVLYQFADYIVKAMAHYALTEAGQAEWRDIEIEWEMSANNEDNAGVVSYSVEDTPKTASSQRVTPADNVRDVQYK